MHAQPPREPQAGITRFLGDRTVFPTDKHVPVSLGAGSLSMGVWQDFLSVIVLPGALETEPHGP